jgi:hypothetical protein
MPEISTLSISEVAIQHAIGKLNLPAQDVPVVTPDPKFSLYKGLFVIG